MTIWNTIEKDGPPKDREEIWAWRPKWDRKKKNPRRWVRVGEYWKIYNDAIHFLILPTDQWTPIIPPDPPED